VSRRNCSGLWELLAALGFLAACDSLGAHEDSEAQPGPAPSPSAITDPLAEEVAELVRRLERDHELAPHCATLQLGLCWMLVELGPHARPYIEAEAQDSPVRSILETFVLEQMPRKVEGCPCRACLQER
jgi:hypothetical protein